MKLSRKQLILKHLKIFGPTPLFILRSPDIGGDAADVRIRELRREHNIPIDYYRKKDIDGNLTNTTIYFLKCEPQNIDVDNLTFKGQMTLGI